MMSPGDKLTAIYNILADIHREIGDIRPEDRTTAEANILRKVKSAQDIVLEWSTNGH